LDEVGDIPIEIQPKLLRALQEREFERLGSTHTRKGNVRLLAATNRNLETMIANKEFRSDLYYRLNVFPIRIPPLRERMNICRNNTQDIRTLSEYARDHRIATDYHINETPMIEQDEHFKHLSANPTYIRPEDWPERTPLPKRSGVRLLREASVPRCFFQTYQKPVW
jgi:hypothetical protein